MAINRQTTLKLLEHRGLSVDEVSALANISNSRFQEMLEGDRMPSVKQVFRLADAMAVPAYAFFMSKFELPKPEIIDFRSSEPEPLKYGKNSKQFSDVIRLRNFLKELMHRLDAPADEILESFDPDAGAEQMANYARSLLRLEDFQFGEIRKSVFYKILRDKIESVGIFTIQSQYFENSIDGFALFDDHFTSHTILINTRARNHGARSFTLSHEFAHIITKRSAISDNYDFDNDIETFCNEFAGAMLMPRGIFIQYIERNKLNFGDFENAFYSARILSDEFKVSISAAFVRAANLRICDFKYYLEYRKRYSGTGDPDAQKEISRSPENQGPEPGVVDEAHLGRRASNVIRLALESGLTTKYEIFENTNIPEKRINELVNRI